MSSLEREAGIRRENTPVYAPERKKILMAQIHMASEGEILEENQEAI